MNDSVLKVVRTCITSVLEYLNLGQVLSQGTQSTGKGPLRLSTSCSVHPSLPSLLLPQGVSAGGVGRGCSDPRCLRTGLPVSRVPPPAAHRRVAERRHPGSLLEAVHLRGGAHSVLPSCCQEQAEQRAHTRPPAAWHILPAGVARSHRGPVNLVTGAGHSAPQPLNGVTERPR